METLLRRFEAWCQTNRLGYLEELAPGADDSELARLRERYPTIPDDLITLFRWRNGSKELDEGGAFVHNFALMSVDEIIEQTTDLSGMQECGEFDSDWWWEPGWVPFLRSWSGNLLCIDLVGCFGGSPGQVLEFVHDDSSRTVEYPSIRAWLTCLVDALDAGLFSDSDGDLEASDEFADFESSHREQKPIVADASGKREDGTAWNSDERLAKRTYFEQDVEPVVAEVQVPAASFSEALSVLPKAPPWTQGQELSWETLFDSESEIPKRVPGNTFLEKVLEFASELGRAEMAVILGKFENKGEVSLELLHKSIRAVDDDPSFETFCRRVSRRVRTVDKVKFSPLEISVQVYGRYHQSMNDSLRGMGLDPA